MSSAVWDIGDFWNGSASNEAGTYPGKTASLADSPKDTASIEHNITLSPTNSIGRLTVSEVNIGRNDYNTDQSYPGALTLDGGMTLNVNAFLDDDGFPAGGSVDVESGTLVVKGGSTLNIAGIDVVTYTDPDTGEEYLYHIYGGLDIGQDGSLELQHGSTITASGMLMNNGSAQIEGALDSSRVANNGQFTLAEGARINAVEIHNNTVFTVNGATQSSFAAEHLTNMGNFTFNDSDVILRGVILQNSSSDDYSFTLNDTRLTLQKGEPTVVGWGTITTGEFQVYKDAEIRVQGHSAIVADDSNPGHITVFESFSSPNIGVYDWDGNDTFSLRGVSADGSDTLTLGVDVKWDHEQVREWDDTLQEVVIREDIKPADKTPKVVVDNLKLILNDYDYDLEVETVGDNATVGGTGGYAVAVTIEDGGVHSPGNSIGIAKAKTVDYKDGSAVLIEIGKNDLPDPGKYGQWDYDKVEARNNIVFAKDGGDVTVYLHNYNGTVGNTSGTLDAPEIFKSLEGLIQLDGDDIADVSYNAENNTIVFTAASGSTITFVPTSDAIGDTLTIETAVVGADSKTLGVTVRSDRTAASQFDLYPNQNLRTIGNVLFDEMVGTDLYAATMNHFLGDLQKLQDVLAELDPSILSAGASVTQNDVVQFNRVLNRRLDALGSKKSSCDPCAAACGSSYNERHLWFESTGNFMNQSSTEAVRGFTADSFGFGLGLDTQVNQSLSLGAAFGGSFTKAKDKNRLNREELDNYLFSVYGRLARGQWMLSFTGGYVYGDLESDRHAATIGGWAQGDRNADTGFASVELAYRLGSKSRYLTPFIGFDYVGYREDAFAERGELINMKIGKQNVDGYLQSLGVRFGGRFRNAFGLVVAPELTLAWLHDYGDSRLGTAARFLEGGGPFVLEGTSRNRDRALIGFGLNSAISKRTNLFARYDGELADHYSNQTVQVGLDVRF